MIFDGLSKYKNSGLLLLRVGIGLVMAMYGFPKILGGSHGWVGISEPGYPASIHFFPPAIRLAASVVEFIGGVFMILGFATRPVCVCLLVLFAFALRGELLNRVSLVEAGHSIELIVILVGLFILGPGRYSVDKK